MSKVLKYQSLIDSQNLNIICPEQATEVDCTVYRWCTNPIIDQINFLPNLIENERRKRPKRVLKDDNMAYGYCSLSFFLDLDQANSKFARFPKTTRLKLGYTNIAKGYIKKTDGLMTKPNHETHSMFYEYDNIVIGNDFISVLELK